MKLDFTRANVLLAVMLFFSYSAMAQFTVKGTVKDAANEALIGVSILVKGTTSGTITDFDGSYSINVPSSPAALVFSYTGFASQEVDVSESTGTLDVTMTEDIAQLDAVVVTGLASTVSRRNSANAVASISSEELTGVTSQATMDGALYGKFSGAEIRSNSGAPGGGMSVRLRGVTSIFGDQQPLYIIDGIYVDNKAITLGTNIVSAASGGGNASPQHDASNRIADIDPDDIASIDVLKGASAAAMYGSRAAGGVVIITTKKGEAGKTRITLAQDVGFNRPIQLLGTRDWTEEKVLAQYDEAEVERYKNNPFTDYEAELYDRTSMQTNTRLEISGGTEKTKFFVGGTYKNQDGIVDNTGYEKASLRMNIGHKLAKWLKMDVTSNYIDSKTDRGFFNNGNTNTTVGYALAFTKPWDILQADADGVYPANKAVGSNVLETIALVTNREEVNRFLGGATLTADLLSTNNSSLKLMLRGGLDQYALRTTAIFPQELSFFRSPGTLQGVSVSGSTINQNINLSAFLVHSVYTNSGMNFRTQVGVTQEDFDQNTVLTTATGLNGSQTNVGQAANFLVEQIIRPQQDKGFFIQEEINWNDKIIATVGMRGDKSSNNGDANKLYYYPKANVAINLSNFDFFTSNLIDQLKVRAAYGQAGRFANFNDRFNAYNPTFIGANSGLETSTLLGNGEVGPERQSELEFGTDISILKNALSFGATYYIKEVDDILLQANIPTSSGYTRRVVNAGSLENKGIELNLSALPVQGKVTWATDLRWWKNNSEVTRLDIPAFNLGGFAASLGQYRIQEGQPATQIVGTYNPDDCENGDCSGIDPDGDGFRVYGDAEPDFNMSWSNSVNIGNFQFNCLFHWKQGGEAVNLSTLLYDLAGTTWDYDDTSLDPSGEMGNGDYRTSQWFAGNAGPWIEDNGYIRLREIGAYYTFPSSSFRDIASIKVGVSGRNLINIFDYNSYDPEASNFGGNVLANNIEVTPFPASKAFNFHLKFTF